MTARRRNNGVREYMASFKRFRGRIGLLMAGAVLALTLPIAAHAQFNEFPTEGDNCLDDRFATTGGTANCTANDVTFVLLGLGTLDDGCVAPTDTVDIIMRSVTRNTTAQTRYDIGQWIAADQKRCIGGVDEGDICADDSDCDSNVCLPTLTCSDGSGTNQVQPCTTDADCTGQGANCGGRDALFGECYREFLHPVDTPNTCGPLDLAGGDGPFVEEEGADPDLCGDLLSASSVDASCIDVANGIYGNSILDYEAPVTIGCFDTAGGGKGSCSITSTTVCDADNDCPGSETCVFGPNGFMNIPTCASWGNEEDQVNLGRCSTTTSTLCQADNQCPGSETCVEAGVCATGGVPDLVDGVGTTCFADGDCGGGQTCIQTANTSSCDGYFELTIDAASKCRCEATNSNVPAPDLSAACTCTTVAPGFPADCSLTITNNADCNENIGRCAQTGAECDATEPNNNPDCRSGNNDLGPCQFASLGEDRYQCGTAAYVQFEVDDGGAAGEFSGICSSAPSGWCSTTTTTDCTLNSDCPGGETCEVPVCETDADCLGSSAGSNTCSFDNGGRVNASVVDTDTMDWIPDPDLDGFNDTGAIGIIRDQQNDSVNFTYTVDGNQSPGDINLNAILYWDNDGFCSGDGTTPCDTDADCSGNGFCHADYGADRVAQTILDTTCTITVDATYAAIGTVIAYEHQGQVTVEFETVAEQGSVRFDLERLDEASNQYLRVNDQDIPAQQHAPGAYYRVPDPVAVPGATYQYRVVEYDRFGSANPYGPFEVTVGKNKGQSKLKNEPQAQASAAKQLSPGQQKKLDKVKAEKKQSLQQSAGSSATPEYVAKLTVETAGLVSLDVGELAQVLGLTRKQAQQRIGKGEFDVSNRGQAVAWDPLPGNNGIAFYAEAIDSRFTRTNVYWIGINAGRQMEVLATGTPATAAPGQVFRDTVHLEQEVLGRPAFVTSDREDFWFWDAAIPGSRVAVMNDQLHGIASGVAELSMNVHGVVTFSPGLVHRAEVFVNGVSIGTTEWSGNGAQTAPALSFDQSLLNEGANEIRVEAVQEDFFVDSFDVSYNRLYRAVADSAVVRADLNAVITVENFLSGNISVFDITDPNNPLRLSDVLVENTGPSFRASFTPGSPDAEYLVASVAGAVDGQLVADSSANLIDSDNHGAYVVVAPQQLAEVAQEYVDYRLTSGLPGKVVLVSDIMDEFNFGIYDPAAIQNFVKTAAGWQVPIQYLMLLGKGNYDYKDNLGLDANLVPPILVATPEGLVASDNLYGDIDGDQAPDIGVGRVSVLTQSEAGDYLQKIKDYEAASGDWVDRVMFAADNPDVADFAADSDRLVGSVPAPNTVEKVYLGQPFSLADARAAVQGGFNNGLTVFNWTGHGGFDRFAAEGVLRSSDVPLLQNGAEAPLVTALTCNIGMFSIPGFSAFGEELVSHAGGGAIAVWAPMGMAFNFQSVEMGDILLESIFNTPGLRLGDAIRIGIENYADSGGSLLAVKRFGLLGDPALEIKR